MIQRLLFTLFFINNNPNQTSQLSFFLVETTAIEFFIVDSNHYTCLCITVNTLFWSILLNVSLSCARLESNCQVHIQRQAEHVSSSTAVVITSHCIASYLHSEATMMPIAIYSQQAQLIFMMTEQGSLAVVAQVVLSFLLSLFC